MTETLAFPAGDELGRLVSTAAAGNEEAWSRLHNRYRALLSFQAQAGMPDQMRVRFDPDDVVQSALLAAFKALPSHQYRGEPAFRSWLKEIVRHELTTRIRANTASKRSTSRELPGEDPDRMIDNSDEGDSPSQVYMRRQSRAQVLHAMEQLADSQQEVLWMRDFEHETWEAIARVQDCTPSTARRRHHEALEALVRRLR